MGGEGGLSHYQLIFDILNKKTHKVRGTYVGFCVCSALSFVTVNLKTLMLTDFREFPNTRVTNERHNALIPPSVQENGQQSWEAEKEDIRDHQFPQ